MLIKILLILLSALFSFLIMYLLFAQFLGYSFETWSDTEISIFKIPVIALIASFTFTILEK